ncbi:MAG: NADH-quinone oxidoreductase subunit NuoK [Chloroflexi bacterium]|nr:NADH-quinone oxidoreductase subunit NuoK [Chloroflexota bacterium]
MGLNHYLTLSALVFCIGLYGVLARRNAVGILMAVEIMLNAVNIALVAMSRYVGPGGQPTGQIFAIFVITVAAAEAAVALALLIAIFRTRGTVDVEEINLLRW